MRRNNRYYHHHPHHLYKLPPSLPFAALRPTFLFCIQLMFYCSRSLHQGSCIRGVLCQVVEDKDKTHRSGANGVFRFLFNIISSHCSFPPFSLSVFSYHFPLHSLCLVHFHSSLHTLLHFSSYLRFLVQSPESRDTCFLPPRVLNLVTLSHLSRP